MAASKRSQLVLTGEERLMLDEVSRSRTVAVAEWERAQILLHFADGVGVAAIARELRTHQKKVIRCLDRAAELGVDAALKDRSGRGRKPVITPEARAWLLSVACQKPEELGYSYELWTIRLLARHIRAHAEAAGHPCLQHVAPSTVPRTLSGKIQPHRIEYYLEKRDPDCERKMADVLHVYKEVALLRESGPGTDDGLLAVLSYDEKPGLQAIENTAPDLPPGPRHASLGRDHEYVRHGTMTLMAAIDLLDGHVLGSVVERHTSSAFIDFLGKLDAHPAAATIRVVLDNHSIHVSKETCAYLASRPNRFEFVFTPKHGSWLNLIESFFGKMAKSMLRGIRVCSKAELKQRIDLYFEELNCEPVVFRWRYGLDELAVA